MTASPQARLICSARTVVRGKASERLKAACRYVKEGQEIGFRRIRVGVAALGIHAEIPADFEANGFSTGRIDGRMQKFFHGTGHGLDIHEAPGINCRNHTILKTGHVVTVEPGLYYPGKGGVRLEDVVLVTKTDCKNLVRTPKILEV
jgi:Xaa-Pro aminopeptidase